MREIERRMALLRLMIADITARQEQSRANEQRLRAQYQRIIDFAVQRNAGVANALALLAETEERLRQESMTLRHLEELRQRAQSELDALRLTRRVADAQQRLADLEARRQQLTGQAPVHQPTSDGGAAPSLADVSQELAEIEAEIAELNTLIVDASESAARALAQQARNRPEPLS
jgi:DNA repair exonuclease SbcCD ATPase subunit